MSDVFEISNADTANSLMDKVNSALEGRGLVFTVMETERRPGSYLNKQDWVLLERDDGEDD